MNSSAAVFPPQQRKEEIRSLRKIATNLKRLVSTLDSRTRSVVVKARNPKLLNSVSDCCSKLFISGIKLKVRDRKIIETFLKLKDNDAKFCFLLTLSGEQFLRKIINLQETLRQRNSADGARKKNNKK
jgi:hypothetical protein